MSSASGAIAGESGWWSEDIVYQELSRSEAWASITGAAPLVYGFVPCGEVEGYVCEILDLGRLDTTSSHRRIEPPVTGKVLKPGVGQAAPLCP